MDIGDILHMLIIDEYGTPISVQLINTDEGTGIIPNKPIVSPASDITNSSFTANWSNNENTVGYYLDVARDSDFTIMLLNNKDVGNVNSYSVSIQDSITPYYYRIRAYNLIGTSISSDTIEVIGIAESALVDLDGNEYTTITIGAQEWIVENLKVTKYADGSAIPNITDGILWGADTLGTYCWYDNDIINKTPYGALYNWYAETNVKELVYFEKDGVQQSDWRIPTSNDWDTLITNMGEYAIAGGKLKEMGLGHWLDPNLGATDIIKFKGLPGGYRDNAGGFNQLGELGMFFVYNAITSINKQLSYNSEEVTGDPTNKNYGFSVRCVRDIIIDEEMKYLQTINLTADTTETVVTPLTSEPYNIFILDEDGNDITSGVSLSLALVGGVYEIYVYSIDTLSNVKLKVLY